MSFKKPIRAFPIRPARSRVQAARRGYGRHAALVLAQAAALGVVLAIGSVAAERQGRWAWRAVAEDPADTAARERSVFYPGCDEARIAGAAPIYAGDAGYRSGMDGDGDGIACE